MTDITFHGGVNDIGENKSLKENRTCKEICKKFIVKKPTSGSRYGAGQGRCQTCDVWIDYRGAHTKDGSPAVIDSLGWFCDCCNYRIRQKPRNKVYKERLKDTVEKSKSLTKEENIIVNQTENKKTKKQIDYGDAIESNKENKGNVEFFEGINDTQNDIKKSYTIENECEILIKNYKKRTSFSEHNIGLMEDMIEAYYKIRSLQKLCQEAGLDISIIRRDFRNLLRVPTELRESVTSGKLIADPILATEIAIYATDYFEWDQEIDKTNDVIEFAKKMAQKFKNTLNLRKEFFATKDDYSKPISTNTKKNNELNAILEDWPVKESKYEFNRSIDRTGKQYKFIVFYSKDLDAVRFLRRWEYEKGRRISKKWASEIIDQIKNQGNVREFVKEHSKEFKN